jgi:hypothetical protein
LDLPSAPITAPGSLHGGRTTRAGVGTSRFVNPSPYSIVCRRQMESSRYARPT